MTASGYAECLKDVEPLLAGAPQATALAPVWSKAAQPLAAAVQRAERGGLTPSGLRKA